jgi:hypothetical protein
LINCGSCSSTTVDVPRYGIPLKAIISVSFARFIAVSLPERERGLRENGMVKYIATIDGHPDPDKARFRHQAVPRDIDRKHGRSRSAGARPLARNPAALGYAGK